MSARMLTNERGNRIAISVEPRQGTLYLWCDITVAGPTSRGEWTLTEREAIALRDLLNEEYPR